MNPTEVLAGIDFGTSNTVVSFVKNGNVDHFTFSAGNALLPTRVWHKKGQKILITGNNRNLLGENYSVVRNIKRAIGKEFKKEKHDRDAELFGTVPKAAKDGSYCFTLEDGNEYTCMDIVVMILQMIKEELVRGVHPAIRDAVLSVPANFNSAQRLFMKQAATTAGWNVLSLVNEPSAASVAASLNNNLNGMILVFDLGGGTLDVTILEVIGDKYKVVSSYGDPSLGGNNFDLVLLQLLETRYRKLYNRGFWDKQSESLVLRRKRKLMDFLIQQKEVVSELHELEIPISDYTKGADEDEIKITEVEYIHACKPLFQRCIEVVRKSLSMASPTLTRKDIQHVILVGGGSRFPSIKQLLKDEFPSSSFYSNNNVMEIVSRGCAVCGKMRKRPDFTIFDQLNSTIAIQFAEGPYSLFKAGTPLPAKQVVLKLEADEPGATSIEMKLVELRGDEEKDRHELWTIVSQEFEAKENEYKQLEFTFEVSDDGILSVRAVTLPDRRPCVDATTISVAMCPVFLNKPCYGNYATSLSSLYRQHKEQDTTMKSEIQHYSFNNTDSKTHKEKNIVHTTTRTPCCSETR